MWKLLEGRLFVLAAGASMAVLLGVPAASADDERVEISALPVRIKRQAVDSTNLASAGYDHDARVLEIEFKSGAVYRYLAVPPAVFEELMRAASKGRFFSREIRGKYEFQRVREARP
jgi:hypothetical protein